jgi:hypothetical protein
MLSPWHDPAGRSQSMNLLVGIDIQSIKLAGLRGIRDVSVSSAHCDAVTVATVVASDRSQSEGVSP